MWIRTRRGRNSGGSSRVIFLLLVLITINTNNDDHGAVHAASSFHHSSSSSFCCYHRRWRSRTPSSSSSSLVAAFLQPRKSRSALRQHRCHHRCHQEQLRQPRRRHSGVLFSSAEDIKADDTITNDNYQQQQQQQQQQPTPASSVEEYSFFDQATIYVRAGSGGQGANTYKRGNKKNSNQQGPPDGGNGGKGGDVVLIVDPSLNTLAGLSSSYRPNAFGGSGKASSKHKSSFIKSFRAENGQPGTRQCKSGRYGKDCTVRVPPGTVIKERVEQQNGTVILRELGVLGLEEGTVNNNNDDIDDERIDNDNNSFTKLLVVARGGIGGEGTAALLRTKTNRPRVGAAGGERKTLELTLKVVADVALVGVPNAGKSTFLAAVTRAKPRIANYPFTTVIPNLGVWVPPASLSNDNNNDNYEDEDDNDESGDGLVLCDVPGLIAGASDGVGLGHAFLRHVERCHVILHLVDATSENPIADYQMINKEIVKYGTGQLATMPQVVVINKIDSLMSNDDHDNNNNEDTMKIRQRRQQQLQEEMQKVMPHTRLMWMSAKERDGVDDLMQRLAMFVKKVKNANTATNVSVPATETTTKQ